MKHEIELNIRKINAMKVEQGILKGETYNEQLSEAGRSVLLKEIDAIQVDVDELTEQTIRMIAQYANS